MRQFSTYPLLKQVKFLLFALVLIGAGCSLEKQSGFNRAMQNLTAHYNILFNAKEILRLKLESYSTTYVDNYNELLSVYQDTTAQSSTPDKDLDAAIVKANTIISIKEQSHYLGDAYLVLGKANYLGGNFFNATEYFTYVINYFPKRLDLVQDALIWKARSLMYLNRVPQAKLVLDTALKNIDPKKKGLNADVYATKLQYDINAQEYADGEEMAKKALQYCTIKVERLRWTFILAQLQELNQKPADAIANYSKIAKSNALFEMAFNASLNRIRIEDHENGVKISRIDRLLSLLKDPNNKEFKDQIYYQVAELQMTDKSVDAAIKNYNLSIRNSQKNQNQKGLSYLRLAQINFNIKANYIQAKKYYDSTLNTLPATYPGYKGIQKIGNNLQILADRLQIIIREDTLQALAKMDDKTRSAIIDKMVNDKILQQQAAANSVTNGYTNGTNSSLGGGGNSSFYFYNSNAISQGYNDFKRVWGTRKLEDNWRRSSRSNTNVSDISSPFGPANPDVFDTSPQNSATGVTAGNYRKDLLRDLPLTPNLLAQSNLRIYNAYIDIGNFYRDILDDKKDAIATFELVLKRFPNDPNIAAVYYSLYRLYGDLDPAKADRYKSILLKDYASTNFAKVIIDPDFAKKLNDVDAQFTGAYNQVFDLYAHKQYKDVISRVPELMKQYPDNKLAAQLYYLQTIAAGHNETVVPFRDSLLQIVKKYPNDKLIDPLVNAHLVYINGNMAELQARATVLPDEDPNQVPFTLAEDLKEKAAYRKKVDFYDTTRRVIVKTVENKKPVENVVKHDNTVSSIFSMRDSTHYFFIVNVSTATTNLASSRFGIGQFNRTNYAGNGIRHQVMYVAPDNQLIVVGKFNNLDDVKKYARKIIPLMPDIMKVPPDKYSFFIITQENLNKLADKKLLDSYNDYYQKNY